MDPNQIYIFVRSQLILIYSVCNKKINLVSVGQGLRGSLFAHQGNAIGIMFHYVFKIARFSTKILAFICNLCSLVECWQV